MTLRVYLLLLATIYAVSKAGFVPPAEWCLPSAHLKELSGCIAMTDKEDECGGKASDKEKLDCYCTQEMLSSFYEPAADCTEAALAAIMRRTSAPTDTCLRLACHTHHAYVSRQCTRSSPSASITGIYRETLPSIDLTSFLGITETDEGSHVQSSQSATDIPGVDGDPWTTGIKPAPAGTTATAAQTARDQAGDSGPLMGELR
ncbi:hypothetical protein FGG08_002504 [Glutinoglossum americanum]|uniref:Extracellular membrane protein CFEM domain-containing protein n=1 Tax=Glutinoglossum americanum TaxID=1670608 RepID=A0A9P8I961_9PEZI|nr:hypothetical protein FGG08_002504 [Glutinoglossum americanum]